MLKYTGTIVDGWKKQQSEVISNGHIHPTRKRTEIRFPNLVRRKERKRRGKANGRGVANAVRALICEH